MVNIVIPTYKRAGRLVGANYFRTARFVLPESQRDEYRRVLPADRMIVIPDKADGAIARKRNWILQNIERPLVMIDDDVRGLTHSEAGRQNIMLAPDVALDVIERTADLAMEWGCRLFGFNLNTDGRNYQQYKPFTLTQPVLGPFSGHLEHDILYDERMDMKEDYDMSLMHLNRYRKVLRWNKFAYACEHGTNLGGIVSYRTMERERRACEAIMAKWGREIISYRIDGPNVTMGNLLNGRVRVPIMGV
ncbi:MAG: hypothetical protein A4E73_02411 [Syntrophaceae bacterium PtaU1.Bin231]|nr:MAG: hypothetical protein A4E73_02411 [Syntrophaceae bacterium PtaU1.Bin231]